ncbi:MAG: PIN domain-containing protein [Leptolyngbya sp.]|nr:PIN domain-containing protein [Candidatus Melainabacteria bacterium]
MAFTEAFIDAGPLVAYYNKGDNWHKTAENFFETFKGKLITSEPVATEVMWLLSADWRVQNEFLMDLQKELFLVASLTVPDFRYIAELNEKYKDLPGDFADLSIVALSQRFEVFNVVSLDSDFDIYRSYGKKAFRQLFPKHVLRAK